MIEQIARRLVEENVTPFRESMDQMRDSLDELGAALCERLDRLIELEETKRGIVPTKRRIRFKS